MSADLLDPLADVLALLRPQAVLAAELHARGRWSLAFDRQPAVKFGVVVEGECLVGVRGRSATKLGTGDVFLLGDPPSAFIASDRGIPSRSASELLHDNTRRVVRIGSARAKPVVRIIGGHFLLDPTNAHVLLDALPACARIPEHEASPLRALMPLLIEEVRAAAPGRARALDQLAQLVLTYALRWLDASGRSSARSGWLRALAHAQIGAALRHIHTSVETGTSLAELARVAGMSRTAFVTRFRALVGQPPLAYAIHWRMSLAKDALRTTDRPIGQLAFQFGYASESAFSMAFRREVGCSPRAYRNANASPR